MQHRCLSVYSCIWPISGFAIYTLYLAASIFQDSVYRLILYMFPPCYHAFTEAGGIFLPIFTILPTINIGYFIYTTISKLPGVVETFITILASLSGSFRFPPFSGCWSAVFLVLASRSWFPGFQLQHLGVCIPFRIFLEAVFVPVTSCAVTVCSHPGKQSRVVVLERQLGKYLPGKAVARSYFRWAELGTLWPEKRHDWSFTC